MSKFIIHYGVEGQKWGVRNAEWYPIADYEAHLRNAGETKKYKKDSKRLSKSLNSASKNAGYYKRLENQAKLDIQKTNESIYAIKKPLRDPRIKLRSIRYRRELNEAVNRQIKPYLDKLVKDQFNYDENRAKAASARKDVEDLISMANSMGFSVKSRKGITFDMDGFHIRDKYSVKKNG